jgi:hypothetical protein
VSLAELGHDRIRSVTHHGVGADDIDYALDVIRSLIEDQPVRPVSVRRNHDDHSSVFAR